MTMHKALHPRNKIDRLYVSRKVGRQCWRINTTTWRLHTKAWRKTDYNHQKQYWQHENQQNDNNQKTKMGRKTTVWIFKTTNKQRLTQENMDVAKKENLKRETESFPIVAQNNTIRTNHIKARIDKTQQNSKCGDIEKTINHIISECSKLAQKE